MKKILCILLTLTLVFGMLPSMTETAFADTRNGMSDSEGCSSTMRWSTGDNAAAVNANYTITVDYLSARPGYLFVQGWVVSKDKLQVSMPVYVPDGTMYCNMYYRGDVSDGGRNNGFNIYIPMSAGQHNDITFMAYSNNGNFQIFYVNAYVTKPTASFDMQGGSGGTASVLVDYKASNPTITVPIKTGYDFQGYYSGKEGTGTKLWNSDGTSANAWSLTGSKTVYAYWTPHVYDVTLDYGDEYIESTGTDSVKPSYDNAMPEIITPKRYGYTFDGYWTQAEGGTQYYTASGTSAKPWDISDQQETTLYAHWNLIDYEIKYYDSTEEITDSSAATINNAGYVTHFTCEDAVTLPTDVTKENAIFNGWYDSSNLDGNPVFSWVAHMRVPAQSFINFYANWIEIQGTRADSEKQVFDAAIFGTSATPTTYYTAEVDVTVDGAASNVNQLKLIQDAKEDITMAGTDGTYIYTTSDDVSGEWKIYVNGADSGKTLEFSTADTSAAAAGIDMVTAKVTVRSDGNPATNCNVILKKASESDLTLSETETGGVYTLQTFSADKDYEIFVNGEGTDISLNLENKNKCQQTVNYRTVEVTTIKDGTPTDMGAVELRNETESLSLTGSDGKYSLNGLESDDSYIVYVDSKNTGISTSFKADNRIKEVNYYTVTVNVQKDSTPTDMGGVTLCANDGTVKHTLESASEGVYTTVAQASTTSYKICVGEEDTGITAGFTVVGQNPPDVNYETATVNVCKDSSPDDVGTVELTSGDQKLTVPKSDTGKYELTKLRDTDTSYSIYIAGQDTGEKIKFSDVTADKQKTINYSGLSITLRLNASATDLGTVTLKKSSAANSSDTDVTLVYDTVQNRYTGTTCHAGAYDIFLDSEDTGENIDITGTSQAAKTLDYYTLHYDLNGGKSAVPADKNYKAGSTVTLPADLPLWEDNTLENGYQFTGWSTDGSSLTYPVNVNGDFDNTTDNQITISESCHNLTAIWKANSEYEARYQINGADKWTYSTIQFAFDYTKNHPDNTYAVELLRSASLTGSGSELASNTTLKITASGTSLGGNFTNNGIIELKGTLTGTVNNYGTIDGSGTKGNKDNNYELSGAGTIKAITNQDTGKVYRSSVGVTSNAGLLSDCSIISGTKISGNVAGTVYASSGVTFASDANFYDSNGQRALISLAGGGTVTSGDAMNGTLAFAGLMSQSGEYFSAACDLHLRSRITVNNNQVYANFYDFVVSPTNIIYDSNEKAPTFYDERTPGLGAITSVRYKQVASGSDTLWASWTDWTESVPVNAGTYQVEIDVSDGDYFFGKNKLTDSSAWQYTIHQKEVTLDWSVASGSDLTYGNNQKYLFASATNLEDGDSCDVTVVRSTHTDAIKYNDNVNVGDFTFTAVSLSNPNYRLPYEVASCTSQAFTIQPKSVMLKWLNTVRVYTGFPISPEALASEPEAGASKALSFEIEPGDIGKVTVTASSFTDAGNHLAVAATTNTNYCFTNGTTDFTINKAPLSVSVTNNIFVLPNGYNSAELAASETDFASDTDRRPIVKATYGENNSCELASPGNYTIKYAKGKSTPTAILPDEPGTYDIYMELATDTSENFCFSDSTTARQQKIGVYIISRSELSKYTVSFSVGEGNIEPASITDIKGSSIRLPEATSTDKTLAGWKYAGKKYMAGDIFTIVGNAEFTAIWQESYALKGTVYKCVSAATDTNKEPAKDAVVTIMKNGKELASVFTGKDGIFDFASQKLVNGTYQIRTTYFGQTRYETTEITATDTDIEINLPYGNLNTAIELKSGTPDITVSNLEDNFNATDTDIGTNGGKVDLILTAESTDMSAGSETDFLEMMQKRTTNIGLFMNISLRKVTVDAHGSTETDIREADKLIDIILPIPAEYQNKATYTIYRCHEVDEDQYEVQTISTSKNKYGEYIEVDRSRNEITLHVKLFSIYALGYTEYQNDDDDTYKVSFGEITGGRVIATRNLIIGESITAESVPGTGGDAIKWLIAGSDIVLKAIPDEGYELDWIKVTRTSSKNSEVELTLNEDGTYSFKMPFGDVVVNAAFKEVSEATGTDISGIEEKLKSVKLRANTKYVFKNGKRYIKAYATILEGQDLIDELKDEGYTVKYTFYRGTVKKSSAMKRRIIKKAGWYINNEGKNGAYYYYRVKLGIYDREGKLVASTKLSQCRYGSRLYNEKGKSLK